MVEGGLNWDMSGMIIVLYGVPIPIQTRSASDDREEIAKLADIQTYRVAILLGVDV